MSTYAVSTSVSNTSNLQQDNRVATQDDGIGISNLADSAVVFNDEISDGVVDVFKEMVESSKAQLDRSYDITTQALDHVRGVSSDLGARLVSLDNTDADLLTKITPWIVGGAVLAVYLWSRKG